MKPDNGWKFIQESFSTTNQASTRTSVEVYRQRHTNDQIQNNLIATWRYTNRRTDNTKQENENNIELERKELTAQAELAFSLALSLNYDGIHSNQVQPIKGPVRTSISVKELLIPNTSV